MDRGIVVLRAAAAHSDDHRVLIAGLHDGDQIAVLGTFQLALATFEEHFQRVDVGGFGLHLEGIQGDVVEGYVLFGAA